MVQIISGNSTPMTLEQRYHMDTRLARMPELNSKFVGGEHLEPAPNLHNVPIAPPIKTIDGGTLSGGTLSGGTMRHHPSNFERFVIGGNKKPISNFDRFIKAKKRK